LPAWTVTRDSQVSSWWNIVRQRLPISTGWIADKDGIVTAAEMKAGESRRTNRWTYRRSASNSA
jgi:hypothetical protein